MVGPNGEQVGIVRVEDALRLAQEADLDLVEVAPDARPPVCKLMDFGKYKYEADMKAREARRNQANTVLKEIRFRLKIDPHDYGTKKGHVERFLKAGDKVKVMIMFRGREQSRPEMGLRLLQRLAEDVIELGHVESSPRQDGRNMIMVLGPAKKKSEARNEQRRRTARTDAPEAATETPARPAKAEAPPAKVEAPAARAEAPAAKVEAPADAPAAMPDAPAAPIEAPAEVPEATDAAAPKPVAAKPAAAKPVAAKPTAAKPTAAKPTAVKPTAAKPTAAKPAADSDADAPAKPAPKPRARKAPTTDPQDAGSA